MFEKPPDSLAWFQERGFIHICPIHHTPYDSNIGCKECLISKRRRLFDDVIWSEQKPQDKHY